MTTALVPTITEAGLARVFRATADGVAAQITHIAVGDSAYTPAQNQSGLRHEVARFPIADGVMVAPTQAHMTALDDTQAEYWVREVGFYLSDGTLFAVYSHPTQPLAYKTAGNDFLHAYDLLLTAVPVGSVVVNSTGARLSLFYGEEFAKVATALVAGMRRELIYDQQMMDANKRIDDLNKQLSMIQTQVVQSANINVALIESVAQQRELLIYMSQSVIRNERMHIAPFLK